MRAEFNTLYQHTVCTLALPNGAIVCGTSTHERPLRARRLAYLQARDVARQLMVLVTTPQVAAGGASPPAQSVVV